MNRDDNPFAGASGGYSTNVQYGGAPGGNGAAAGNAEIKDVTTASFSADVLQESRRQPVLVDFWAPWCGPCKQLAPVLEKVVGASAGRVKLVKMNIDDHPAVAGQLGIQSIPAVIAFKNGQAVDGFMGAVPESQIRDFIDRVAGKGPGPQAAEILTAATQARETGDLQTAVNLYETVLAEQPDNPEALGGLADLLLEAGDRAGAEEVLASVPEDKKDAPQVAAVRTKFALADQAAALGDPAEFERRLAADPDDHQARFDLAMIQNALGKRTEAADNLLTIVKQDRSWNDDGARAQLLKFFEAWGMMDEVTLATRRKLSSLLFS
ncbi:thioredoxin [Pseudaminobacter sp. 19-2017]|uniref:Thioredoxin n=1 Tax=Pseudaminobacter soli (ex Zhang et al. 2022) TaxID=2831468 RepID=A0A942I9W3_9HYPH|nr:thioredoxin [Pseudaminobacter soli]MBS3649806.1 thioredoxin [Pseudaminobacter soli]